MNEQFKKVNNSLFSAAVTGVTYEDVSQNAVLLPAKEKAPTATLKLSQGQILDDIFTDKNSTFHNQQNAIINSPDANVVQTTLQNIPQHNQLTNLASNFTNNLNIVPPVNNGPQACNYPPPVNIVGNIPPSVPTLSGPPLTTTYSVPPVPVVFGNAKESQFLSQGNHLSQAGDGRTPLGNVASPINVFRRSNHKRPTYAPIPELSKTVQQPLQPLAVQQKDELNLQSSALVPENTLSGQTNAQNYFKPICVPPATGNFGVPISQPLPIYLPKSAPIQSFQSPVMAAIPDSEVMESNISGSDPSQYINNDNGTNVNPTVTQVYRPVYHHWFYKKETDEIWTPFTMVDSLSLEQAFTSNDLDPDKYIATDGDRYDVNILRRQRIPVYWQGAPSEIRRCSWFHKSNANGRLVPYEENVAAKLEEEYKFAFETNQWHKEVELYNKETVVFHGPDVLVWFPSSEAPDTWGNTPNQNRPRVVKRGMDEFDINEGEPSQVDHILFIVHGIGSVCDLKGRSVEEVVEEFRNIARQLVQSHYRSSHESGKVNRVEVLPISWHEKLHSEENGIDQQLKNITLESIPKIRYFTNDTLLDILFYTSPVYCQSIVSAVGNEINRVYDLFKVRNPGFQGGVSLGGHSLGSLILFDLLCHQHPEESELDEEENHSNTFGEKVTKPHDTKPSPVKRKMSRRISYLMGSVGTGQPQINYPHLNFKPKTFFALGSPIGMFVIIRGLDTLGEKFSLPTCPTFFNIFHPNDPIAYRIESLIHPDLGKLKPVLIPHHKGRKRMHLELRDTAMRVGADLKQKVIDSMKSTWNSLYQLAMFHKQYSFEETVDRTFQEQLEPEQQEPEEEPATCPLGNLNNGRRIDYVLQEAPVELINQYLFVLHSHVCYWESHDTVLLMLKEIYSSMNIEADSQIPQQTMTIERASPSPKSMNMKHSDLSQMEINVDPMLPVPTKDNVNLSSSSGFIRKS